jgi:hypothetical protein
MSRGARAKQMPCQTNARIPSRRKLGLKVIEQQIWRDGVHQSPTQSALLTQWITLRNPLNPLFINTLTLLLWWVCRSGTKDCGNQTHTHNSEPIVLEATHLTCYWLFKWTSVPTIWDQRGWYPTQPSRATLLW